MAIKIEQLNKISQKTVSIFKKLIFQLDPAVPLPNDYHLKKILSSPSIFLFIARDTKLYNKIVGTITLVLYLTPTGIHAQIEDLVVEKKSRRKGIGRALVKTVLRKAQMMKANHIDLSSRPFRKEANRLYYQLGFKKRHTNIYRYRFLDKK